MNKRQAVMASIALLIGVLTNNVYGLNGAKRVERPERLEPLVFAISFTLSF